MFYCVVCCTYHGSLEMKCPVSGAKRLMLYHIYRVLSWNSSWRSPIGLTQSDLMTSSSHGTADWFSPVSVANELTAQYSNTWLLFGVAVWQRTSETLHLPQLHLYRSATRWFMYAIWGYSYLLYSGVKNCWPPSWFFIFLHVCHTLTFQIIKQM